MKSEHEAAAASWDDCITAPLRHIGQTRAQVETEREFQQTPAVSTDSPLKNRCLGKKWFTSSKFFCYSNILISFSAELGMKKKRTFRLRSLFLWAACYAQWIRIPFVVILTQVLWNRSFFSIWKKWKRRSFKEWFITNASSSALLSPTALLSTPEWSNCVINPGYKLLVFDDVSPLFLSFSISFPESFFPSVREVTGQRHKVPTWWPPNRREEAVFLSLTNRKRNPFFLGLRKAQPRVMKMIDTLSCRSSSRRNWREKKSHVSFSFSLNCFGRKP